MPAKHQLCEAQSLPFWAAVALYVEGVSLAMLGQHATAEVRLPQSIQRMAAIGGRKGVGYSRAWRAIALAHLGRFDEAWREAADGHAICEETAGTIDVPPLSFAQATLELLDPLAAEGAAEQWLNTAMREARERGMRLYELRAATALARLRQKQGKPRQAHELLATIYGWFTEGFDALDLKEARALLDQLGTATEAPLRRG